MDKDMLGEEIEKYIEKELSACMKCHLCNMFCPIVDTRVTQGSFGINRAIYYGLKWNEFTPSLRDLVYSCTTCGKCEVMCTKVSRALPLRKLVEKAREYMLVEKMAGPMPEQTPILKNMYVRGNPWGNPSHERTKWAKGLEIHFAAKENPIDVLYFVGCACSYDPYGQKIARSLCTIFKRANIHFGILENESCSGHEARRMGEVALGEYLAEANLKMFEEAGIRHIVTGDPHSFYTFTKEYPENGNCLTVQHYTQFFNDILDQKKLVLSEKIEKKVTYHDPCYLGRHSGVFDDPRKLIKRIPGIVFKEIENNRELSDCCGMGGGRMWMEPPRKLAQSQVIAERRVQQALDTGAEILLTACPFCNIALTDAVKSMNRESSIEVMDLATLVAMSLK